MKFRKVFRLAIILGTMNKDRIQVAMIWMLEISFNRSMSQRYNYTIKALEGRQFIQRNFVTLPEKGSKYSNRAISLNERFSVIERGYILVPDLKNIKRDFQKNVRLISRVPVTQDEQKQQKTSSIATKTKKK
ncbi:Uncharacterized protein BM_BM9687 [Brugia malayi]|uniref:Bm9687, isoform b n=3 Tax=Brugia TaxID=6278 RepID=A0A0J9XU18_BRUMA|nr:Uncharacterized protein BM_BM9687 [Brugia malayi]CDP95139.1 Bm9687, isoform b [Brugia malayi]VDO29347.1 unnamed protein product [Brugia timori]VIO92706.1 Uncharacterized protein BM_BM9687 [Brugia malayi]